MGRTIDIEKLRKGNKYKIGDDIFSVIKCYHCGKSSIRIDWAGKTYFLHKFYKITEGGFSFSYSDACTKERFQKNYDVRIISTSSVVDDYLDAIRSVYGLKEAGKYNLEVRKSWIVIQKNGIDIKAVRKMQLKRMTVSLLKKLKQ